MATTRVVVWEQVMHPTVFGVNEAEPWRLWLQWVTYVHPDNEDKENGFRFIWRRPDGSLQAARGQARLPNLDDAELLIKMARAAKWGNNQGHRYVLSDPGTSEPIAT